jgi:septum formation protein
MLASASPARLGVLRAAGLDPIVEVSDVGEDAVLAELRDRPAAEQVTVLAAAKAAAVADRVAGGYPDALVIGCDSMLLLDGVLAGKPRDVADARARWQAMAGGTGELLTGHCVLRLADGEVAGSASDHAATTVHFGRPNDTELDAYLASGEPLAVAGAFTLDGRGGWFVDRIEGDPSNVIGISLPLIRRMLEAAGLTISAVWQANSPAP